MGATATALAAALVTVALCAAVPSAQAYVHHRTVHFNASAYVYYFSEGPMFASGSGPFGSGGDSTIGVDVVLTQPAPDPVLGGVLDSGTVINLAFFDEDNAAAMGWIEAEVREHVRARAGMRRAVVLRRRHSCLPLFTHS